MHTFIKNTLKKNLYNTYIYKECTYRSITIKTNCYTNIISK